MTPMNPMMFSPRRIILLLVGLTAIGVWVVPTGPIQQLLAFLLLWGWPILTWQPLMPGGETIRWLAAASLPLLLNPLLTLVAHYLPGPLPRGLLLGIALLVALLPLLWEQPTRPRFPHGSRQTWLILGGILVLALALRLANMGYKELQGDEGVIMVRAAAALTGDDSELFLHQKGPVEILLPMQVWGLTGAINDFWARLPFTWASLLTVATLMLLARRWFDRSVAWLAGAILAVNGFAVAFARIIQYQSLVMLWGTLALVLATEYRESGNRRALGLAAFFLAGGLLAHYDAVLVVPALAGLVLSRWWATRQPEWRPWFRSAGIGLATLALFYLPFVLNPNFGRTFRYLLNDRVGAGEGGQWLNWSGAAAWRMMTFYNSTWTILALILLVLVAVVVLSRQRRGLTLFLHLLSPAIFYLVVVVDPRTHVYTLFPAGVIAAAAGSMFLWQKVQSLAVQARRKQIATLVLLVVALFYGQALIYTTRLFVLNQPELQRTWAENQPAGYPVTWAEPPLYGLFGFPYQAGWRAVADMLPPSAYPYASNEEEEITNWYMAQAERTHCPNFNSFILTQNVQDEMPYDAAVVDGMDLLARVLVRGRETMRIYSREPVESIRTIEATHTSRWLTPAQIAPPTYGGQHPVDLTLQNGAGGQVRLLGYDLSSTQPTPGSQLVVTLYWQALTPFTHNYQVFVHLSQGTNILAQGDGAPECAINPTTRWEPGQIITDPHLVDLPETLPADSLSLTVGLYDLITLERMTLFPVDQDNIPLLSITPLN
jgi:hypothetical protein